MAEHSKRKKKGKLIVLDTLHQRRHADAVRITRNALKDIKDNRNVSAVVICIETTGGYYNICSSYSDDKPRLGGALINMGLVKMGYKLL